MADSETLDQSEIDALLRGEAALSDPTPTPAVSASDSEDGQTLTQEELDALLAGGVADGSAGALGESPPRAQDEHDDLLTQEELDALLESVAQGTIGSDLDSESAEESARPYDFTSPDLGIRGFVFTLEMVNERFARNFHMSLFNLLRSHAEVSLYGIQVLKFGEYANGLPTPISVNMFEVNPVGGVAMVILDSQLILNVVDVFYGGGRFRNKLEGREFTASESRMVELLVQRALKDLREAWHPVMAMELKFLTSEVNPHFAGVVSSGDVVVVGIFHVHINDFGGELHVVFPYSLLEPLREYLTAPVQTRGLESGRRRFRVAVTEAIQDVYVEVSAVLTETQLTLGELMHLKCGDVLPVEVPPTVPLLANGVPLYRGEYGMADGKQAVRLIPSAKV